MRALTFRQQLWSMVLLVLGLLVTLAVSGWWGIHRVSRNLDQLYVQSVLPAEGMLHLLDGMHRIRAQSLFAVTEESEEAASKALAQLPALDQTLTDDWQRLQASLVASELRSAGERFEQVWAEYRKARDQSVLMIEVGDLSSALHNMKFNAGKKFQQADEVLQELISHQRKLAGSYQQDAEQIQRWVERGEIAIGILGLLAFAFSAFALFRGTARTLGGEPEHVTLLMGEIASGNLQLSLPTHPQDQGSLLRAVQHLVAELTQVLQTINSSARRMGHTSHQIATISHEIASVSQREHERASAVTLVTTSLHQATGEVHQLAVNAVTRATQTEHSAQEGLNLAEATLQEMASTVERVQDAALRVDQLDASAKQIHRILEAIDTIASQTNLLALNAAIEAARAAEAGRGFAVVAGEVRLLAGRTAEATREIADIVQTWLALIQEITVGMRQVVTTVRESQTYVRSTAAVISAMAQAVAALASASREITDASEGQTQQVILLQERLKTLFEVLEENTAKVGLTAIISSELLQTTESFNQLMQRFTFNREPAALSARSEDLRRSPRFAESVRIRIFQDEKMGVEGMTQDISQHGLRFLSKTLLDPSRPLQCEVRTPYPTLEAYQRQIPLMLTGRIVWHAADTGQDHSYGIEFDPVDAAQQGRLQSCFS